MKLSKLMTGVEMLQVKLDEEETSNFRDLLLPLIIGLLRTVSNSYSASMCELSI